MCGRDAADGLAVHSGIRLPYQLGIKQAAEASDSAGYARRLMNCFHRVLGSLITGSS